MTPVLFIILAGIWRVVDGRGKEWLPVPTWGRNAVTFAIALCMSYLTIGDVALALWAATFATLSLIKGFENWNSLSEMLERNAMLGLLTAAPFVIDNPVGAIIYVGLYMTSGAIHWFIADLDPTAPWIYGTGFTAGAAAIGGIALL